MDDDLVVLADIAAAPRVPLSYDSATKAVGPIGKLFDAASNKWLALGDAAKAEIAVVDEAKITTLRP